MNSQVGNNPPLGWALTTLGEICVPTRPRHQPQDFPQLPFIGMEHVESHSMRLLMTVPARTMKSSAVHFMPGDVLYGRLRPYLNKIYRPDFEGLCSAEFIVLPHDANLESKYLQYFLNSSSFVVFATHLNTGDRPRVDYEQLASYPVPLPPLHEQRRMVAEIEKQFTRLEAALEALKQVQANLKRYRASVLKVACEGRLVSTEAELARVEGRDYEPADKLLARILKERRARWEADQLAKLHAAGKSPEDDKWKTKYKDPNPPDVADLAILPEGWTWAALIQLAFVESGQTPMGIENHLTDRGDVPWFRVGDMNLVGNETEMNRVSNWILTANVRALGLHVHPKGTIIFPKRGGAIATNKKRRLTTPSCYDLNTMGLIADASVGAYFSWWFAKVDLGTLGDGSNVPQINHGDIEPLSVPLPPEAEQRRIVAEVERRLSVVDEMEGVVEATLKRAERLRQAILKRAFEGKLVPQDPNDEPASVLLERIRDGKSRGTVVHSVSGARRR